MSKEIYMDAPNVGELEKVYLNKAVDSGYISSVGPFVSEFENRCAAYLGIKRAVSTNSGTSSLHIALYELGIGPGDEVIVPVLTFIATVNAVSYVGATPVLVDVDIETWNMDPGAIEQAITNKTKAIIPVHLYGNPCDMNAINQIAAKHDLYVIEDSAESLGAKYRGKYTGTLGDLGCFSFNGNKTISTGGGGMVVGDNLEQLQHIKYLVNQARDEREDMYHSEIGFNFRMTNLSAALGLAQIQRLETLLAKKRKYNQIYREELGDLQSVTFQKEEEYAESSYWLTCITLKDVTLADELRRTIKARGIPVRRIFTPLNEFPPYRKCRYIEFGNANSIYERGVCLPSSTRNVRKDIKFVSAAVKDVCCESRVA